MTLTLDKGIHLVYHTGMSNSRLDISRYQKIMKLRSKGKTFQEIAEEMKVSRQRVWQIWDRANRRFSEYVEKPTRNGENSGMSSHIAV